MALGASRSRMARIIQPAVLAKAAGSLSLTLWYYYTYGPQWGGGDGQLYIAAASRWLAGGDPWKLCGPAGRFCFVGLPPTVALAVPFALLPGWLATPLLLTACAVASVYVVRRLRLPIWVLLSPPIMIGAGIANPHILVFAALISGRPLLAAIGAAEKIYTVPAMLAEQNWRAISLTAVVFVGSVVILWPLWATYLPEAGQVSANLVRDTNGGGFSAYARPSFLPTLAALLVLAAFDWRAAGWIAVPALFPGTQIYVATFLLPVSLPLYVAASTPLFGVVPIAVAGYVLWRVVTRRPVRWRRGHGHASPTPSPAPEAPG
jgi:hypothetical protein